MITNEKQYRSTRVILEKLGQNLKSLDTAKSNLPAVLLAAQRSALKSQIEEMAEDVALYESLKAGDVTKFEARGLHELPDILIRARIARGMSQKDLAEFLGLKEQQIQRYEAERYRSASLDRLIEIAGALSVEILETAHLSGDGTLEAIDPAAYGSFPIAEMYKRGWFEDFEGSLAQAKKSAHTLIPAFFRTAQAHWTPTALHRKSVRSSAKVHESAIAAWEARILSIADRASPRTSFSRTLASQAWVDSLVRMSSEPDGPKLAVQHLRDIGIVLVIEPHLPGTLLDGAAMRTADDIAAIGLTLRHDRLDNFWFTLLHEVAHLMLHIGAGQFSAIFDDTDAPAHSDVEREADYFAQEALLPTAKWHACLSRFSRTEKAVLADAKKFHISPAIIAGRIRREAGDYTLLRSLVGAGEPRKQLTRERT
jgi:HTH-type transcriptional regulator/antitoxin HigA